MLCLAHTVFVGSSGGCTVYSVPNLPFKSGTVISKYIGRRAAASYCSRPPPDRCSLSAAMADIAEAASKRKRELTQWDVKNMELALDFQKSRVKDAEADLAAAQADYQEYSECGDEEILKDLAIINRKLRKLTLAGSPEEENLKALLKPMEN